MRTETTTRTLYTFSELSEAAQSKALDRLRDINLEDWHEATYEDAANVGLKITGYDVGRGESCEGHFINGAEECANKIKDEHGVICDTYKTATVYLEERDEIILTAERDEETGEIDEYELDARLDKADADFLKELLGDYLVSLREEFEYQQSDEAVRETIEANGYEFTEDGKLA